MDISQIKDCNQMWIVCVCVRVCICPCENIYLKMYTIDYDCILYVGVICRMQTYNT